jgi:hypothetical protein
VFPQLPDYARRVKEIIVKFELRVAHADGSGEVQQINDNTLVVRVNRQCRADSIRFYVQSGGVAPALLAGVEAPVEGCARGEARLGTSDECVPVSCKSERACAADVGCRALTIAAARANGGVGFVCGCAQGDAWDGHVKRCVPVNCSSACACPPSASGCEDFAADQHDDCENITPSQPEQWRRGSRACPRYTCM